MVIRKANTYRLYPTPEQAQQMAQIAGSCRFVCTGCGHEANADTNAAIVILQRGLDESLKRVDGHLGKRPDEARSIRRAA
jgi:hypothetical protein